MLDHLLPPKLLRELDVTTVLDDQLELVPTALALRLLRFSELWDLQQRRRPEGSLSFPLSAQLEFTQKCNLSCKFCYNNSGPNNSDELDLDALRKVCEDLAEWPLSELVVSGGEPLLRKQHLQTVFDALARAGIPIHLLTNGILLSEKVLEWLAENNVLTIQVSVDGGDPVIHDTQRGRPGAWHAAMRGIALAHEHGFHTMVSCTLTKANAESLPSLIDYAYLLGVDVVTVSDVNDAGRGSLWGVSGACTDDQLDAAVEILQTKRRQYRGLIDLRYSVNMVYYICALRLRGQQSLLVRGNGDVLPSCTLPQAVVGNVHERSVGTIWAQGLKDFAGSSALHTILSDYRVHKTNRLRQLRCWRPLQDHRALA